MDKDERCDSNSQAKNEALNTWLVLPHANTPDPRPGTSQPGLQTEKSKLALLRTIEQFVLGISNPIFELSLCSQMKDCTMDLFSMSNILH